MTMDLLGKGPGIRRQKIGTRAYLNPCPVRKVLGSLPIPRGKMWLSYAKDL